jgi:hypothetical protein
MIVGVLGWTPRPCTPGFAIVSPPPEGFHHIQLRGADFMRKLHSWRRPQSCVNAERDQWWRWPTARFDRVAASASEPLYYHGQNRTLRKLGSSRRRDSMGGIAVWVPYVEICKRLHG